MRIKRKYSNMTSRNLDGSRVIKAAEERLAFAHKCEKIAQGQVDRAMAQLEEARREVKKAGSFLEETREKLQVIDVDEEDVAKDSGEQRKEEESPSPDDKSGTKVRSDAESKAASSSRLSVILASDSSKRNDEVEEIVITGAGSSEVNGTYERCQSHRSSFDKTVPVYSKRGSWKGEVVTFFMFRRQFLEHWHIGYWKQRSKCTPSIYYSEMQGTALPPKSHWLVNYNGTSPPPQLKW